MANPGARTSTSNLSGDEYQVFLSFRGPDTRRGFTNTLYNALKDAGIHVFINDEDFRSGDIISGDLLQAINNSKLYIPIFSRTYASSHWCLRELAKMMENTSNSKEDGNMKVLLPIFYNVKHDDMKLNTPLYRDALLNLEQKMEDQKKKFSSEDVETWRQALRKVDVTKGWELEKYPGDGDLCKTVVDEVVNRLQTRQREVSKDLFGMEDRIAAINNLLGIHSDGVRLIGIFGIGGIGKTTLAKLIFNQLCPHFGKNCSFLEDIRQIAKTMGLEKLREQLLSDISNSRVACNIGNIGHGINLIQETIHNKKVLIVLDDVDEGIQIQDLIGVNSLHPGTRIIVTTRDKGVLNIRGFKYEIVPYEMEKLSDKDALQLLCKHAFHDNFHPADYYTLGKDIISTLDGLPLAIATIGSALFGLGTKKEWEKVLGSSPLALNAEKIRKEQPENIRERDSRDIMRILKISYDDLEPNQQQIFLDIACFFSGHIKVGPISIWKDCGFRVESDILGLIHRSIIKESNGIFFMHDLLRELGRSIAIKEGTRLWAREDILSNLRSAEIKRRVQALHLRAEFNNPKTVTAEQIKLFPHLQFLWLSNVICKGDFADCLSKLKWISVQYSRAFYSSPEAKRSQGFEATNLPIENLVVVKLFGHEFTVDKVRGLIKGGSKLKVVTYCCDPPDVNPREFD